jgi:predicted transcriptional regulator
MQDNSKQDQSPSWSPDAEDQRDQEAVLVHVISTYPTQLRLSDLIRELARDSDDFREKDQIERAVRDLIGTGLLFRCEGLVLPTRPALRFNELTGGGES